MPGLLIQLALFGSSFVGFAIISEWRAGIIERYRVTPVSRLALLTGRVLRDVVTLIVQSTVLILAGRRVRAARAARRGPAVLRVPRAVSRSACPSLSYAVALRLKSEDAFAPLINSVVVPLILLSGVMLPMTLGPGWLQGIARISPYRYIIDAMREAYAGHVLEHDHGRGAVRGGGHRGAVPLARLAVLRERELLATPAADRDQEQGGRTTAASASQDQPAGAGCDAGAAVVADAVIRRGPVPGPPGCPGARPSPWPAGGRPGTGPLPARGCGRRPAPRDGALPPRSRPRRPRGSWSRGGAGRRRSAAGPGWRRTAPSSAGSPTRRCWACRCREAATAGAHVGAAGPLVVDLDPLARCPPR